MAKALTTQSFLEVEQIKEGVVILKDRSLRAILMVSSINFALKSQEEQEATLYQFQDFLNSLDFSLQVIAQSRKLNIAGYIEKLKQLEAKQTNELLKIQTTEYRNFVTQLISEQAIMSKQFFAVIPFTPVELGLKGAPPAPKQGEEKVIYTIEQFKRYKFQLFQRVEFVSLGLRRCGLDSALLDSPQLIELFWSVYHPAESEVGYYPEVPPELSR